MSGPLIHIGYHKTGTTWLQRNLFRNARAGFRWGGKKDDSPVNRLVTTPSLDFDPGRARADFASDVARAAARGAVYVISLERLSGHPFSGGYDSAEIAAKLRATFPEGRVLVVVREQRAMIASTYKQYIKAGGAQPLRLFLEPPAHRRPRIARFDLRQFEYHRLLGRYHELFGTENVLALPYEQLGANGPAFAGAVLRFAGRPTDAGVLGALPFGEPLNVARRGAGVEAARCVNRLFVRRDVNPLPVLASARAASVAMRCVEAVERRLPQHVEERAERRLRDTIAEVVGDRYRESNEAWMRLTGVDLGALGYDVGTERSVGAENEPLALG